MLALGVQHVPLGPVLISTPTNTLAAGEAAGTLFLILDSGHDKWINVTGSVTENVAATSRQESQRLVRASQRNTGRSA
jgi:hypothetical protein